MLQLLRRRHRDERGAVLMMSAMMSTVFMIMAAFAVDLGVQRVARRDMQALADVVALDMARQLDGVKTTSVLVASSEWTNALAQSIGRNDTTVGTAPTVTATPGKLVADDFVATAAGEIPSAVEVAASTVTDYNFVAGTGDSTRWAVAAQEESACFGVGSFAARLATADSVLLNSILGDALGTTVLGYNGLANANVSLLGLTAALAAASPTGVLDPSQVKLGDFVLAAATVLTNTPGAESADVGLLQSIYAQLDFPNTLLDLGEFLNVGTGNMSAIDANVNVLDMIYGAALVADGEHFVTVPSLTVTLPKVTSLTAQLTIIEAPQTACEDGTATTSQIALRLTGSVNTTLLGALGVNLATVTGTVSVTFNLANASATLADVHCTGPTADSISLNLTNQNLASTTVDFSNLEVKPLLLPSVPLLGLTISTAQPNPSGTHALALPTYYYPNMYKTPQGTQTVPHVTSTQLSLLGIPLGATIVNPLLSTLLNPIITQVNTILTNVVNPVLGLNLAGADLFAVPTATCGKPALRG